MVKYSLVMTPTPCRTAGYIISVRRTYSLARALTYTVGSERIKPAISPKRLKIETRVKATINGLYKVVHGLSIAAKMYDLNDL